MLSDEKIALGRIGQLETENAKLRKDVEFYERDGAMIKNIPLETVSKIVSLESKLAAQTEVIGKMGEMLKRLPSSLRDYASIPRSDTSRRLLETWAEVIEKALALIEGKEWEKT